MIKIKQERNALECIIYAGIWAMCAYALTACTIKIDNPFYAPSTLDVNKSTSSGAANYLPSKALTPGVSRQTE